MKYLDIPLLILLVSAMYLCIVYLSLGLVKRLGLIRHKDKSLNSPNTVHLS